jgi:hypothetical protein
MAVILIPLKISPLFSVIHIGVLLFPLFWIQRTYDSAHFAISCGVLKASLEVYKIADVFGVLKASLEVYKIADVFGVLKASLEVYKIANVFGILKASSEVYNIAIVFGIVKAVHGMPLEVYNIASILKASLEAPHMPLLHATSGVPLYCSCLNAPVCLIGILIMICALITIDVHKMISCQLECNGCKSRWS